MNILNIFPELLQTMYTFYFLVCPSKVTFRNNANTTEAVLHYLQDKTTISFIQTQSILKQ